MPGLIKKILAAGAVFMLLLGLAACKDEPADPTFPVPDYSYSPSETTTVEGDTETTTGSVLPSSEGFTVDGSWRENYAVRYTYYDKETDGETEIREVKTASAFEASYPASGNAFYYEADGKNLRAYTLMPEENKYVSTQIENKEMSSLSSTFMKLTAVKDTFPYLTNVLFMREDTVAGRNCLEYVQRAYDNGEPTETVYLWVDAEFGFAVKCEAYDSDENLTAAWEVLSFKTGNVTAKDFSVDVSAYDFTEE